MRNFVCFTTRALGTTIYVNIRNLVSVHAAADGRGHYSCIYLVTDAHPIEIIEDIDEVKNLIEKAQRKKIATSPLKPI